MEKLIRLMANGRTMDEQRNLLEELNEVLEFLGVTATCAVVLYAMTIF